MEMEARCQEKNSTLEKRLGPVDPYRGSCDQARTLRSQEQGQLSHLLRGTGLADWLLSFM
jgi:hypothetical protein